MCFESYVRVRRIFGRKVGREVVEAAVVCLADEGDAAQDLFRGFRCGRRVVYVAEAVCANACEQVRD